jgi:hypothetical protein
MPLDDDISLPLGFIMTNAVQDQQDLMVVSRGPLQAFESLPFATGGKRQKFGASRARRKEKWRFLLKSPVSSHSQAGDLGAQGFVLKTEPLDLFYRDFN